MEMLHFEILVNDVGAAVELVVRAGGRQAPYQPPTRDPRGLRVMLDPAGHPFCLFVQGEQCRAPWGSGQVPRPGGVGGR